MRYWRAARIPWRMFWRYEAGAFDSLSWFFREQFRAAKMLWWTALALCGMAPKLSPQRPLNIAALENAMALIHSALQPIESDKENIMTINGITQESFDALRKKMLETHQADITGTTEGTIVGHGVTAAYKYDAAAQTLSVEVKHRPFFIPVSAIESELRKALQ